MKSNDDNVPYIEWSDERETRTADEVLGGAIDKKNAIDNVEDWLLDVLDAGPVHSKRMKELARDAGHSWRTVERARERLDSSIKIERDVIAGHGAQGPWQWRLTTPSRPTPPPPTVNTGGLGGDE